MWNPTSLLLNTARVSLALSVLAVAPGNAFAAEAASDNPLLSPSALPYHLPPFQAMKDEHFAPAFGAGMAEQLKEVDAIANNPAAPTFDNTIIALERSGRTLNLVRRAFFILTSANTNPNLEKLETVIAPKLSAHNDTNLLNPRLFANVETLYKQRDSLNLDPESKYLLKRYYTDFVRAGAKLSSDNKEKLKALNSELASLQTRFSQNVLAERNASGILVEKRADLAGLSDNEIAAAAVAANAAGKQGQFLIPLLNTTGQPALASLQNRPLREKIMAASLSRGSHGGDFDNRAVAARIALLRAQRAELLGYPNHAAYQLEDQTAATVQAVNGMLAKIAPPAVANARREGAAIQAIIDSEKGGFQLSAADWDLYAEKVRKAQYAFDESQLRPYFEMNRVLEDGVFWAANRLYGITFSPRKDLHGYHPDQTVYEVFNEDGSPLALFLADLYARPSKRGGAWMNAYVSQSFMFNEKPVVAIHLNVPKPPAGEATLLTYDEVKTMFHEFGHALHGMFSNVKYPRFSSPNVPRDFVEYPSQVNEMWAMWPEVLKSYAVHYQTGALMPIELLDKMVSAQKFNQGFTTTEYLSATILDQAWHQLKSGEVPTDAMAFEAAVLKKYGVDYAPVPPRYRTPYFSHTFQGGYSAGYYSYIWSEVLDADTVEWIKAHGGLLRENGDRFRETLLSRGGSEDALVLFRNFTGGDPDIGPLLKRRGLEAPTK